MEKWGEGGGGGLTENVEALLGKDMDAHLNMGSKTAFWKDGDTHGQTKAQGSTCFQSLSIFQTSVKKHESQEQQETQRKRYLSREWMGAEKQGWA